MALPVPTVPLADGTTIPQIGFGTLNLQPDREDTDANAAITAGFVAEAAAAGYRHFDIAQSYGSQRGVGQGIRSLPRGEVYLTSKLANGNHSRDDVHRSFEASLQTMGVDYLDLFLIHWPLPTLYGGDYVSTWRAVLELLEDGRLRTAGVSNFLPEHIDRLVDETGVAPTVNQFELHPLFQNRDAVANNHHHGIAVEAHSPLGHSGGPLTAEPIVQIASTLRKTPAQVILRWHLQHGTVVIPRSSKADRMRENIDVLDFTLTDEDMRTIDAMDQGEAGRVGPNPARYEG